MSKCLYSDATVKELAKAYDVSRAVIHDVLALLESTAEQKALRHAEVMWRNLQLFEEARNQRGPNNDD